MMQSPIPSKAWRWALYSVVAGSVAVTLAFVVLIFTPMTNILYDWLEVGPNEVPSDAILLLTSGAYGERYLNQASYQRAHKTLQLYRQGLADKIIIAGGKPHPDAPPYAISVKQALMDFGVPEKVIYTETESANTFENFSNSVPILQKLDVNSLLLVTSSSHMLRSMAVADQFSLHPHAAPVENFEKEVGGYYTRVCLAVDIVREYGAIIYFWLRGWI